MGFSDAQILDDIGYIFSDLEDCNAFESATLKPSDDSAESTIDIIRAKTLSGKELLHAGWAQKYELSIYAIRGDDSASAVIGDIISLDFEGDLRILHIHQGPARAYFRFDLGNTVSGTL